MSHRNKRVLTTLPADEAAKISRESFSCFGEISAEWRKLTLEQWARWARGRIVDRPLPDAPPSW